MESQTRLKLLSIALILIGLIFIFGIYPALIYWPSGWRWVPNQSSYEQMLIGIYITLGLFLLRAARNPLANLSLIWFTVWSSVVHGGIMFVQALVYHHEAGHLMGDVPALFLVAIILGWLTPRNSE